MKGQPPKRKFSHAPWNGECDIYVDGKKIREAHPAMNGHVYLHLPPNFEEERVSFEPFDPRNQIEAELIGGEVIDTEAGQKAKEKAAEEAERQRVLKERAEKKALAERIKREAEAKRLAAKRVAEAEAAKKAAAAEADAAKEAAEGISTE